MDKGQLIIGGVTLAVFGGILALALQDPNTKYAGQDALGDPVPLLEAKHIPENAPQPEYNSNPPTSGPHYANPAPWGVKTEPIKDEIAVHNLEHGGIWIAYQPDQVDQATIDQLTTIVRGYPSKVLLSPRPANDTPIALVSWGRLMKLTTIDNAKIDEFIGRNKNKGPEKIPD